MSDITTLPQHQWLIEPQPEGKDLDNDWGNIHPVLQTLLMRRGFQNLQDSEAYLKPKLKDLSDPFLLPEMLGAVTRIFQAIDTQEEVCILGDYDVDGITSITLLKTALEAYGLNARTFIPIRSSEGYGLSETALKRCMSEGSKPDLLITVDCGTVSNEPITELKKQGIDVIVIDHHEPGPDGRPPCDALVNPKFTPTDLGYLCAAGVVFKLIHALLKTRPLENFLLKEQLDLVAVATISDIVPLLGENRILVRHGLQRLSQTSCIGLRALMDLTGLNTTPRSSDVGFRLGPRINAAGRMDQPQDALYTLLASEEETAQNYAEQLEEYNRLRQKTEQKIVEDALEQLSETFDPQRDPVIVMGSRQWHPGVVGIVASRLARKYYRPAFICAIDEEGNGKGSGRSIQGISLVEAIDNARDLLEAGGGHHMAAGINIKEENLAPFRKKFAEFVKQTTTPEQFQPTLKIDEELSLGDVNLDFLGEYESLQPFGSENPTPVFISRKVWLTESPRRLKNDHIKFFLKQNLHERDAIFFGGGIYDLPEPPWDIAYSIERNYFRGKVSAQIHIKDLRQHK